MTLSSDARKRLIVATASVNIGNEIADAVDEVNAPLTLYVEITGSDVSGDGSKTNPYFSVQKAVDAVPNLITNPVVINVGPGTFDGFRIDNKEPGRPGTTDGSYLAIVGTLDLVTSSTTGGTVSGLVANNSTALSSFTVAGANWTVDELKGKFIKNLTSGATGCIPIISNTSNTVTFYAVTSTFANGNIVSFVEPKTVFNSSSLTTTTNPSSSTTSQYLSNTDSAAIIRISNCDKGYASSVSTFPSLLLANFRVTATGTTTRIRTVLSKVIIKNFITDGAGTGNQIAGGNSSLYINGWCSLGGGYSINAGTTGLTSSLDHFTINMAFVERSNALGGFFGCNSFSATDLYIKGCTTGITMQNSNYALSRTAFESCTKAILSDQGDNYQNLFVSKLGLNGGFFNNCGTCFDFKGPHWIQTKFIGGTGNTLIANVKQGTRFGFRSDFNPAGTTEITMDTANATLADVRAATPKLVNNTYGSIAYESDY